MPLPRNMTALEFERQARPGDLAIDYHGNRVESGCEVKASEQPGFTVTVVPGVASVNGRTVEVAGAGCIHLQDQDAVHHRLDLIVADEFGHVSAVTGAASNFPKYPQTTVHQVVLASVYIPPANTFCDGTDDSLIIDRR